MAGQKKDVVVIAVTGGDAISTNRLFGKSNTGTYFISSRKNWNEFSKFFNEEKPILYRLDLKRIKTYKLCFREIFFDQRDLYSDKMKNFEEICSSLLLYEKDPIIKFELRINDTRIFLKFAENNNEVEYALRGIIYSNLTNLVFERNNGDYVFYLEVNLNSQKQNDIAEEVFYDEFN